MFSTFIVTLEHMQTLMSKSLQYRHLHARLQAKLKPRKQHKNTQSVIRFFKSQSLQASASQSTQMSCLEAQPSHHHHHRRHHDPHTFRLTATPPPQWTDVSRPRDPAYVITPIRDVDPTSRAVCSPLTFPKALNAECAPSTSGRKLGHGPAPWHMSQVYTEVLRTRIVRTRRVA